MPRTSGLKKTRFTLWLSDEVIDELTRQQEATGKGSVSEVIREAVEVYRSLLNAKEAGLNLYFESPETGEKGRMWLIPGPPPVTSKRRKR